MLCTCTEIKMLSSHILIFLVHVNPFLIMIITIAILKYFFRKLPTGLYSYFVIIIVVVGIVVCCSYLDVVVGN